jgi:hypothetical protein
MTTQTVGISSKVVAGGATGIVLGILVYVLGLFGIIVPQDLYTLLVPALSLLVGYLTPEIAIVRTRIDTVLEGIAAAQGVGSTPVTVLDPTGTGTAPAPTSDAVPPVAS